jgi:MoaA/NifB/PqqE/SkfB family radical SAM enzyme
LGVWSRILEGGKPFLSIEITKECPLRCPGCYAYEPGHVNGGLLKDLSDFRGEALVERMLALVRRLRPLHVSIVGGEPLVRYRELEAVLPVLSEMGIHVQVVTSAVRPIPEAWAKLANLRVAVSIDGLAPEHDRRRAPATYDRILKHIAGHRIVVHCTVTRQMLARTGYLEEFAAFWSARRETREIWFSLFTPQEGEQCEERLSAADRENVVAELARLKRIYPRIYLPDPVLDVYLRPPADPGECVFAQTTACVSADLQTPIQPCQLGGTPMCSECGCFASAGLASVGRYKVAGLIPASSLLTLSRKVGDWRRPPPQLAPEPAGVFRVLGD